VITLNTESNAWPAGVVRGLLVELDGCLLIGDSVAVFPHDTKWKEPTVLFRDGETITVGTQVRLGGGYYEAATITQADLPIVPMDKVQACAHRAGVTQFVWARP
jgi:hypothetical protein